MKTRAIFKTAIMMALAATLLVSCGKENRSTSGNSNNGAFGYPGGNTYGNGSNLPNNWIDILIQENPCMNFSGNGGINNNRSRIIVQMQGVNVNAGSMYAGITYEGDVGVVSNQNGSPVLEIFACQRPDLSGNSAGFIMSANGMPPVLNTSSNCSVSEITALDAGVNTQYGGYHFAFYPIYLDSVNKAAYGSALCQY